jgi:hypothetical protein
MSPLHVPEDCLTPEDVFKRRLYPEEATKNNKNKEAIPIGISDFNVRFSIISFLAF